MRCIDAIARAICSMGWGWDERPLYKLEAYAVRLANALGPSEGLALL